MSAVCTLLLVLLANVVIPAYAQKPEPVAGQDYIEICSGAPLDPANVGMSVILATGSH